MSVCPEEPREQGGALIHLCFSSSGCSPGGSADKAFEDYNLSPHPHHSSGLSILVDRGPCMRAQSCPILCDPVDRSLPGSPSMAFSRQEYWSELPYPPPGDLPDPGIGPRSPALAADFFPTELPGKPWIEACMISQIFPGLELPGGIPARAQRTGPGPDKHHLPTRPSRVLQAPPGLCVPAGSHCGAWPLVAPLVPRQAAGGPGPLEAGSSIPGWTPPVFPYRPVLPRRHKLQRLKSRGKKTNSGRGSLLLGGEPGIRGRWEELRDTPVSLKGCVCMRERLTSRVSPLHEGKLEVVGSWFHPPHSPYDLGVFRSAAPRLGCFQLSSHPDGLPCLPQFPDSKPASLLPLSPSSTFPALLGCWRPSWGHGVDDSPPRQASLAGFSSRPGSPRAGRRTPPPNRPSPAMKTVPQSLPLQGHGRAGVSLGSPTLQPRRRCPRSLQAQHLVLEKDSCSEPPPAACSLVSGGVGG